MFVIKNSDGYKEFLADTQTPLRVNFQKWEYACQPLYASCCPVLLYFSRYCTIKMFIFSVCFLCMYYWCEKDYKLIAVQYHRAVLVGCLG